MSIYYMSAAGACPRELAAERLGYEPTPDTPASLRIMKEGKRHEAHVAEDLREMGYSIEDAGSCPICERNGFHVEIPLPALTLVGHLDRKVAIAGKHYPVEIKSMGKWAFEKWKREGFRAYPEYAAQECCYLTACQSPGMYVVKCRDNGELLLYSIGYDGQSFPLIQDRRVTSAYVDSLAEFSPFGEFASIETKLTEVELYVQDKKLPTCDKSDACRWCHYAYLCNEPVEDEVVSEVNTYELIEAARLWKEADLMQHTAEEMLTQAKSVFIQHGKAQPKYQVEGLKIAYGGLKTRVYANAELLREIAPDVAAKVMKESKPFEELRVTLVKVKE